MSKLKAKVTKIVDDCRELTWYYSPPRFFSLWRGGNYALFHLAGSTPLPLFLREALEFVAESIPEKRCKIKMATATSGYSSRKYHLMTIYFKDPSTLLQFKLRFCDRPLVEDV